MRTPRTRAGRRRRGFVLSLELILVLPVVLALVFIAVQFSLVEIGRQRVQAAARQGARIAALRGSTPEDIAAAVNGSLYSLNLINSTFTTIQRGENTGDPVIVEVRAPMVAAAPNSLSIVGYTLAGRTFRAVCVARRE